MKIQQISSVEWPVRRHSDVSGSEAGGVPVTSLREGTSPPGVTETIQLPPSLWCQMIFEGKVLEHHEAKGELKLWSSSDPPTGTMRPS